MEELLSKYIVITVALFCWCVGYIIKKLDFLNTKYIPLIMGVLGLVLNLWNSGWTINMVVCLQGIASGLASTGLHEAFKVFKNDEEDSDEIVTED